MLVMMVLLTHDTTLHLDKLQTFSQAIARDVSYAMAATFIAALLIEHAAWPGTVAVPP